MTLTLACAFAASDQHHEHARIAEDLGYARAWFYDSRPLHPDGRRGRTSPASWLRSLPPCAGDLE